MNDNNELEMTAAEKSSLAASKSAISDFAHAMIKGTDPETAEAALAAVKQANTRLDLEAIRDKIHMPDDAGEHEADLRKIMLRIPEGWGRWISCSAGWYPIIVQLDLDLAAHDPAYELRQVKEKFGGLRYYFHTELDGAREPMRALVKAAEKRCGATCELCGTAGELRVSNHSWYRTLCADCAAREGKGYRPANEEIAALTPDLPGTWKITHVDGTEAYWDLRHGEVWQGSERSVISDILEQPRVGERSRVQLDDGAVVESLEVAEIRRSR